MKGHKIKKTTLAIFFLAILIFFNTAPLPLKAETENNSGKDLYFTILHTNDEHSALYPSPAVDYHPDKENPALGGIARISSLINRIREEKNSLNEPVLLISGGDFTGGTIYNWLTFEGHSPELSLMQKMGYDIIAIGNHEFDNGPVILAEYLRKAGYPQVGEKTVLLSTNTIIPADHPLNNLGIKKTHIKELDNGLKLGFFSIMGNDAITVTVDAGSIKFSDRDGTAAEAVESLKEEGAEIIIAVNHAGIDEDKELAQNVNGIDIIVGGHTHTKIEEPEIINDTIIVQAGDYFETLGLLELSYNPQTKKLSIRNSANGSPHTIPVNYETPEDPVIKSALKKYTTMIEHKISRITGGKFKSIFRPVALSDFPMSNKPDNEENPFGNFVADAIRLNVEKITGKRVDFAFQGSGIIRTGISPGTMDYSKGMISLYDLTKAVALGSGPDGSAGFPLAAAYITGEEIRRILEISLIASEHLGENYFLQVSGVRFTYDPDRIVLFPIPFLNLPFPSTRAVIDAELFIGEGLQTDNDEDYIPLKRGDKNLYHIATDYVLVATAIDEVSRQLPWLAVHPKDKGGNIIMNPHDGIVRQNGSEYKVWQSVLEHFASQPPGDRGYPQTDPYYSANSDRINSVSQTTPLQWVYVYLAAIYTFFLPVILGIVAIIILALIWRRYRKKQKSEFSSQ